MIASFPGNCLDGCFERDDRKVVPGYGHAIDINRNSNLEPTLPQW